MIARRFLKEEERRLGVPFNLRVCREWQTQKWLLGQDSVLPRDVRGEPPRWSG